MPGLSSNETLIYRFFHAATAAQPPTAWTPIWHANGLQDDRQTGQTALRYSLAYLGYASAMLAMTRTPAYLEPASAILKSVFDRMVQPKAWDYWNTPGICGEPWTAHCRRQNMSMAAIQAQGFGWQHKGPPAALSDPVAVANIMYSAHLASIGLLYELLSGDRSLSTVGWRFGEHAYTLETLVKAMQNSALVDTDAGYGVTCEPGSIFPPCQNHLHAALRLHRGLRRQRRSQREAAGAAMESEQRALAQRTSTITDGWVAFAFTRGAAMWHEPDAPLHNHALFRVLRLQTAHRGHGYPAPLGTSFYPVAVAQLPQGLNATWLPDALSKAQSALAYIDSLATLTDDDADGVPDGLFYNASESGMAMQVTANRLLHMVLEGTADGAPLATLFSGSASPRETPHLQSAPWPQLLVSVAYFDAKAQVLRLDVSPGGAAAVVNARLVVAMGTEGAWRVGGVAFGGGVEGRWSVAPTGLLEVVANVSAEASVDVAFVL